MNRLVQLKDSTRWKVLGSTAPILNRPTGDFISEIIAHCRSMWFRDHRSLHEVRRRTKTELIKHTIFAGMRCDRLALRVALRSAIFYAN